MLTNKFGYSFAKKNDIRPTHMNLSIVGTWSCPLYANVPGINVEIIYPVNNDPIATCITLSQMGL